MKLREWLNVRGPAYALRRGRRLLGRYGLAASEATERVEGCVPALAEYGCAPTFPTPGRVVQRYPGYVRHLQELGAEIAVHSYDHVDLAVLSLIEARQQLLRAAEVFAQSGIESFGFRCPYLSCTDELVQTAANGTFDYGSNRAIRWETALMAASAHTSQDVQVLERLYQPASAGDTVCVPQVRASLVEIPVCLPDDLEVHDGLQLGLEGLTQVWSGILQDSHRRGELFDLLFHPELSRQCQQPLVSVLQEAAGLQPRCGSRGYGTSALGGEKRRDFRRPAPTHLRACISPLSARRGPRSWPRHSMALSHSSPGLGSTIGCAAKSWNLQASSFPSWDCRMARRRTLSPFCRNRAISWTVAKRRDAVPCVSSKPRWSG